MSAVHLELMPAAPALVPATPEARDAVAAAWSNQLQRAGHAAGMSDQGAAGTARAGLSGGGTGSSAGGAELEPCGIPCAAPPLSMTPLAAPPPAAAEEPAGADHLACQAERVPVTPRVHVEQDAAGALRVWLGLSVQDRRLVDHPGALGQLRHALAAGGQALSTLVCNGITLYAAASIAPAWSGPASSRDAPASADIPPPKETR
jgi:hypothetical protein